MDLGEILYLYIGKVVHQMWCEKIFGVTRSNEIDENITDLPELDNEDSERLRSFVQWLNTKKSHPVPIRVIRDDTKTRTLFVEKLVDDRSDNVFSYYEFLQHLKTQIK
jgi:protein transport protein SEC24